ncbi:MAG: NAD(P)-dependent alcohol dehydrogenase [Cytophagales bacterium]|nr:NAD(P)-dependent alcohol dehydrogenase [Armatimonadota bacterium]
MNVYELQKQNDANALVRAQRADPAPGPYQIVVQVRAVSLNYRDLMILANPAQTTPRIPVSDGAGEVIAVGTGVTRVAVGDRVAGAFFQNWSAGDVSAAAHDLALGGSVDGMLAEQVLLSEEGVVRFPDHLSYEEAATLPCAAVTVWNALIEQGGLRAGQTVLLLGTGGVSILGLQFAKQHGARVIVTSSSDEKLASAKSLGADETVNYRTTPDWEKAVWEMTGRTGVDQVVEVGGAGTLEKSLQSVRDGGTVSLIGVLTGFEARINPILVLQKSVRLQGIYVGSRATFANMNRAVAQSRLKPVIDRVFPFVEAPVAYEFLRSGSHFGKVVIRVGD